MIHMQSSLDKVQFLVGDADSLSTMDKTSAKEPFSDDVLAFLEALSKRLMSDAKAKQYSDVATLGFWIRKGSLNSLKERFLKDYGLLRMGKGMAFHIAPSNVPVNFAYSLVAGLLTGNINIVRVPSKTFEQIDIICYCIRDVLKEFEEMKPYIYLVRYDRDKEINDLFSLKADMRIVWGGDMTVAELRRSPLPPRSGEITFADRYSIAVIDSDVYLSVDNKKKVAEDFYNDTYLTDQNACTSPRIVIWTGGHIDEAKEIFWNLEYDVVKARYELQAVQAVSKLTSGYMAGALFPGATVIHGADNLITRISIKEIAPGLMDHRDNSGFFFEYDCSDIMDIIPLCADSRCQTIGYIGDKGMFEPLIHSGIRGIDRIVPIGKTMDFDLIWDGYDLVDMLTRKVYIA